MTHFLLSRAKIRHNGRIGLVLGMFVAVSACSDTGEFMFGSRDAAETAPSDIRATPQAERDVEAPEVFDVTDEGLWDGRPSLGGVWVAHPDVADPERVMIRNAETGRFVIGALFRRERERPGPVIQISSDAAAALDILAGDPTTVQVTALRREAVPEPAEEAEAQDMAGAVATADAPVSAVTPMARPAANTDLSSDAAELPSPPAAAQMEALEVATLPEPEASLPREMTAEQVAAGILSARNPSAPPDPIAAVADAAIAEAEAVQTAAARAEADPAAAMPRRADDLDQPYVQIGIFSVRENADNTGEALRTAGLVPTIYEERSNGRRFWRVVVGPAPDAEDRDAVLETVRGLGFDDAYYVAR
jgi:hypothetical protein